MSNQPQWKFVGRIGDTDPIAYGGGFVYVDETGVYGPELTFFEPGSDEQWHNLGDKTPLRVSRILLEREPEKEWWWEKLADVAQSCGSTVEALQAEARSEDPITRALVYNELIAHFGAYEFDTEPKEMKEGEAYTRYKAEMGLSR